MKEAIAKKGNGSPARTEARERWLIPPVDVREDADKVLLFADMPGVSPDGLDLEVDKNVLRIRGLIGEEVPREMEPLFAEFGGRGYERAFTLSPDIDPNRIEARLDSGVLTLTMHKKEESKPRRIEIQVQ